MEEKNAGASPQNQSIQENRQAQRLILPLLLAIGLYIFFACLESLLMAKSEAFFQAYRKLQPDGGRDAYIAHILFQLLTTIFTPMMTALYYFLTAKTWGRQPRMSQVLMSGLNLLSLVGLVFSLRTASIFWYFLIFFQGIILFLLSQTSRTQESR